MQSPDAVAGLEERLGLTFRNRALLEQAVRHRSAVLESPRDSNERMEFLGDSIVGFVVCDYLYDRYPDASEGDLAKAKAYLVSEPTLADAALTLRVDAALEMSSGEESSGGRTRRSILSDAFEAIVAAIYLDQGVLPARRFIRDALEPAMQEVMREEFQRDFKSALQERLQASARKTPYYRIAEETGADHDKTFVAQALLEDEIIGEGSGKSKKQAEQEAARTALERLADVGSEAEASPDGETPSGP